MHTRSADSGRTWQKVLTLEPPVTPSLGSRAQLVYELDAEENRHLFLLVAFRDDPQDGSSERTALYRSNDGGLTWEAIVLPSDLSPTAVAISPDFGQDGLLFVGTVDGEVITLTSELYEPSANGTGTGGRSRRQVRDY